MLPFCLFDSVVFFLVAMVNVLEMITDITKVRHARALIIFMVNLFMQPTRLITLREMRRFKRKNTKRRIQL